ncbi:MAG: bifunctional hydroxymethylpyrimidine kinase/phosphomethylpyrimidine kinase [Bacteroidales bacterium]
MKHYTKVLTIAGSETMGSAGINADIKSISANGCFAMPAVTAIVDETPKKIKGYHHIPVDFVISQIESVIDGVGVEAIKTGMLDSEELILAIYHKLKTYHLPPLVIDPVIVSSSDIQIISDGAIKAFKEGLFTLATIITPNLREARRLLERKIDTRSEMEQAAKDLGEIYNTSVIIKSGEFEKDTHTDILYDNTTHKIHSFDYPQIHTKNVNGTGCSLSATIATYLALGNKVYDAVKLSKEYIHHAILSGSEFEFGHGFGPVNHFYKGAPSQITQEDLSKKKCN